MSALRLPSALAFAATVAASAFAGAQEPAPRRPGRAPLRAAAAAAEPSAPAPAACVPECRSGYSCVQGECVSKCNPGCGAGERCSDAGECEAVTPSPPAKPAAPARRGSKRVAPAAKPAPAEADGNNWGVPPPPEPKRAGEPSGEGERPAAAVKAEAGVAVEVTSGEKAEDEARAAAAPARPAAATNERPGVHKHDGLYLRLGAGASAVTGSTTLGGDGIDLSGIGLATEFALGGTAAPGLVVGGGTFGTIVPTMTYAMRVNGVKLEEDGAGATALGFIGPFVDYYPNPSKGLHVQGSLGLTTSSITFPSNLSAAGAGVGVMLGVGYEWWVGEQWSAGILGRVTTTSPTLEDDDGDEWDSSFTTFGVLATFTYH